MKRERTSTIKLFDWFLRVVTAVLAISTIVGLVFGAMALATDQGVGLPVLVEPPFEVHFADRTASVDGSLDTSVLDERPVADRGAPLEAARASGTVLIEEDDKDTRLVLLLALGAGFGALWTGLVSLRRIVRSAGDGDPFVSANVGRLRWIGGLVIAVPASAMVFERILARTIDLDDGLDLAFPSVGTWVWVTCGLGLLALAEVFREGVALRELEQSTI